MATRTWYSYPATRPLPPNLHLLFLLRTRTPVARLHQHPGRHPKNKSVVAGSRDPAAFQGGRSKGSEDRARIG